MLRYKELYFNMLGYHFKCDFLLEDWQTRALHDSNKKSIVKKKNELSIQFFLSLYEILMGFYTDLQARIQVRFWN